MEGLKFAIDIGTRTVIGVVYTVEGDKLKIIDEEVIEHKKRAMLDGQVHDIQAVSEVVFEVKKRLEERLEVEFKRVSIAAAGRILKTVKANAQISLKEGTTIDKDTVNNLEMEALQEAYSKIFKEEQSEVFYCVGYSIINYYLNDYMISSLEGHKGKTASVELLATFLPQSVIDSLYSVIGNCNMEVESLTLEPIAAMNAVIPKELRLLNLALVDIGAGTSDIAITKDGTVIAYGMVPFAGDEITEEICHHLVVDFNTAEYIKQNLNTKKKTIKYVDVLGNNKTVKADEIKQVIKPTVEKLANLISQKILELNGKSPNAVFLVGGGSQSLNLAEYVSKELNLPKDRVAVRGIEAIKNVIYDGEKLNGPDCVTPIGIALNSLSFSNTFITVKVNGKEIKLYNSGKQRISNALSIAGVKPNQLFAKAGKGVSFKLNGENKKYYGESAKPAIILLNGEIATLLDSIKDGDVIEISFASDGKDAKVYIKDIIKAGQIAKVNGKEVSLEHEIKDGDDIEIIDNTILKEVAFTEDKYIHVIVNGRSVELKERPEGYIFVDIFNYVDINIKNAKEVKTFLNGKLAAFTDRIKDGDVIKIECN